MYLKKLQIHQKRGQISKFKLGKKRRFAILNNQI